MVQKFLISFILCITCTVPDGINREILFFQAFLTKIDLFCLPEVGRKFSVENPNLGENFTCSWLVTLKWLILAGII